ncbi:MAG: hypothetical protein AAB588_00730 [Patescibacteria group bacterium]
MQNLPNCYWDGVEIARKRGQIVEAGGVEEEDYHSHRDELNTANTRHLHYLGEAILNVRASTIRRIIEIGPGAGIATAQMSRVVPNALIDTAGLTPINPYLRWHAQMNSRQKQREYFHYGQKPDDLLDIQRQNGDLIFEAMGEDNPFINRQYIGRFAQTAFPPPGSYDFVYEQCGPIWHNRDPVVLRAAYELLNPQGIMMLGPSAEVARKLLDSSLVGSPLVVQVGDQIFIINRENHLARIIDADEQIEELTYLTQDELCEVVEEASYLDKQKGR